MNSENEVFRNNDSVDINIRSMFFYVLLRWKKIILFFILGALIGSAISFVQMANNKPGTIAKQVEKINTSSSNFNMERVRQVADYQKMYDAQVARDEESYLTKMNPSKVYSIASSYYVFSNEKNIDVIDTVLENMLNRNDEWQRLWKASGEFCSLNAFMELIKISFDQPESPDKVNVESGDNHARGGVLNISASLPDEGSRTAVGGYLHELTLNTLKELGEAYPESFS
ncbi:MAG: hypothetical protein IKN57_08650 [Parasporobacterium sp.]|nr:hypothetical protein [Parasporobacterium sp.]